MRILNSLGRKLPLILFLFISVLPVSSFAQLDGEKLFKTNCSACHMITSKKLIGPGLAGVEERWEDRALLYQWIKNSQSVLDGGDAYANALFEEYNKSIMPAQAVSDEEIDAILNYVNNPPVAEDAAAGGDALTAAAEEEPTVSPWIVMLLVVVLLFILSSLLRNLRHTFAAVQAEQDNLPIPAKESYMESIQCWISRNKTFFAILCIVATVGLAKVAWNFAFTVGVYEGYKPEQPIKFSHKIHAGAQKIDCNYCHSSARHSKTSGIPSANVCMNCHKYIQEGPTTGTEEISKIYASIGWDVEKQDYSKESEGPIKWVKIHNLPDHAYFNHSQHVSVGKIACQTCHGPVEEMDVVEQFAPLTMGWCINCHRETKVNTEGNEYYEDFHSRLSEEMKSEIMKDGKVTVSEYGGMECAKCHY